MFTLSCIVSNISSKHTCNCGNIWPFCMDSIMCTNHAWLGDGPKYTPILLLANNLSVLFLDCKAWSNKKPGSRRYKCERLGMATLESQNIWYGIFHRLTLGSVFLTLCRCYNYMAIGVPLASGHLCFVCRSTILPWSWTSQKSFSTFLFWGCAPTLEYDIVFQCACTLYWSDLFCKMITFVIIHYTHTMSLSITFETCLGSHCFFSHQWSLKN